MHKDAHTTEAYTHAHRHTHIHHIGTYRCEYTYCTHLHIPHTHVCTHRHQNYNFFNTNRHSLMILRNRGGSPNCWLLKQNIFRKCSPKNSTHVWNSQKRKHTQQRGNALWTLVWQHLWMARTMKMQCRPQSIWNMKVIYEVILMYALKNKK